MSMVSAHATVRVRGHNLTGDPYYTDGKRAVAFLSKSRTTPKYITLP